MITLRNTFIHRNDLIIEESPSNVISVHLWYYYYLFNYDLP